MKVNPGSVFVFPAAAEVLRNPDVSFPFRQESNFFYLSGFEEPDSFLVLAPAGSQSTRSGHYRMALFVRHRDPEREMWEGERYGVEGALKIFGADEAYTNDQFDAKLADFLSGAERVYYRLGINEAHDRRIVKLLEGYKRSLGRSGKGLLPIVDPSPVIGEMRIFKTPEEMEMVRKACRATAEAHKSVMKELRPGMNEGDVQAMIEYHFHKNGCRRIGFGTIVGGGKNAACLHYVSNNESLRDGELVLIDAGGEADYYSADITRTFPIGKKFNPAQGKAYDVVLQAQMAAIEMTRPGITLVEMHRHVCEVLLDGFLSIGLLHGNRKDIFDNGGYKRFYPHNTSHYLGMDVHDVGYYQDNGEPRKLEPGMVFTIEPGLYVQPSDRDVSAEFHGLGIRIEDDVLVTKNGHEVLTGGVPKARAEIEALRG